MKSMHIKPGVGYRILSKPIIEYGLIKEVNGDSINVISYKKKKSKKTITRKDLKDAEINSDIYSVVNLECKLRSIEESSMVFGMRQRKESLKYAILHVIGIEDHGDFLAFDLATTIMGRTVKMVYNDLIFIF